MRQHFLIFWGSFKVTLQTTLLAAWDWVASQNALWHHSWCQSALLLVPVQHHTADTDALGGMFATVMDWRKSVAPAQRKYRIALWPSLFPADCEQYLKTENAFASQHSVIFIITVFYNHSHAVCFPCVLAKCTFIVHKNLLWKADFFFTDAFLSPQSTEINNF